MKSGGPLCIPLKMESQLRELSNHHPISLIKITPSQGQVLNTME